MYEDEIWKPIPDFPNYEMSDTGWVRNLTTQEFKAIDTKNTATATIKLSRNGKTYHRGFKKLYESVFPR